VRDGSMATPVPPEAPAVAEGGTAVEELPAAEVAYLTVWESSRGRICRRRSGKRR
jgi:hypothetical protein